MTLSSACPLIPGFAVCLAVSCVAFVLERLEHSLLGPGLLGALVFAILIGIGVRSAMPNKISWQPGINFSSKTLLESAIVLLGASISFSAVGSAGLPLIICVFAIVGISIWASFAIARLLGLSSRLAMLIACGNSICGNSAIVAIAPVIDATSDEVAAALSFTAVLGIAVVLLLPVVFTHSGLSIAQYGALSGLTVYAVPQVLAATAPAGLLAAQTGTLIKLLRVLMLGPVIFTLGMMQKTTPDPRESRYLVPWFIIGFILSASARALGLIPVTIVPIFLSISSGLTVVAMAALGLSVNVRTVWSAGGRVILASGLSLMLLAAMSYVAAVKFVPS